ncbi:MAG TPA: RpiB/LacA/LacB family sugar-phosphate isomerase [Methylomirabilota bacterium]|nr:RpiB/LacA/LacB family sugar-phosphate isomerase [Methylomirabilota bacterium]
MRIAIGCDDQGFPLKEPITAALEREGHDVLDLGTFSTEPVDYPDYARAVGQAVLRGFVDVSIFVAGSGLGASISTNKMRGIRAALCYDAAQARQSREEENANVLCLSASLLDAKAAVEITRAWVAARFSDVDPHARRVAKIAQLEAGLLQAPEKGPGRPTGPEPATAVRVVPFPPPRETAAPLKPQPAPQPGEGRVTALPARETGGRERDTERERVSVSAAGPAGGAHAIPDAFKLPAVLETVQSLEAKDFLDRLWVKDAALWKGDAAAVRNRLGWLTSPTIMRGHAEDIRAFADEIRRLQFSQVVLLGMGGSSLAGEVFSQIFGSKMGFPDLHVLDTTDPAAVKHLRDTVNLGRTLFLVSTKSGTTTETLALYAYFRAQVEATGPPKPGMQFAAITDPGRPLDKLATETSFRRTFLNPASIGGRYSALSFFGLVPAALIGVDIKAVLERAHGMVEVCGNETGARDNPALLLGAALAGFARAGRDKVTLVASPKTRALGPWIEQLLAESLGKDGRGVIPVVDEPLGPPEVYGDDRVFVTLTLEEDSSHDAALARLAEAGHPVIRIPLKDPLDVGAEFFRWEFATATAGAELGVNPFDEPDVARAKENTATLLATWKKSHRLPEWPVDAEDDGIALMAKATKRPGSVAKGLSNFLTEAGPGDYLAIQAYLTPTADTWNRLQELRVLLRDRLKVPTTVAYGPRYLHSTGQLHKGGRPNGLFIQLTAEDKDDVPIPGASYGFSTLKAAQALGDLQTLRDVGRRVIRLHLAGKQTQGLQQLMQTIQALMRKL